MLKRTPLSRLAGSGFALLAVLLMAGCTSGVVIEDESVAAWMTINNSFADGDPDHVAGSDTTRELRTGVLIQVGNFAGCEKIFEGIEFESRGRVIKSQDILGPDGTPLLTKDGLLEPGSFTWINIKAGRYTDDPCPPGFAYYLYPSLRDVSYHCSEIDDCAFGSAGCDCDVDLEHFAPCIRGRLLHGSLDFKGLITFWQGEQGYTLHAKQESGKGGLNNKHRFESEHDFAVEIYLEQEVGTEYKLVLLHTFKMGQVTKVRIKDKYLTPDNGMKQDPPWTPTQGC